LLAPNTPVIVNVSAPFIKQATETTIRTVDRRQLPELNGFGYRQRVWHTTGYQLDLEALPRELGCQVQRALQVSDTEEVLDIDHDSQRRTNR
jgi:hypothetical protein